MVNAAGNDIKRRIAMYLNFDILFSTTGSVYGREITQHLGILIEREVAAAEDVAAMNTQYAALAAAMNARAKDIGADAVVGVDFKLDALGDKLVFSMTGNAVRLKPAEAPEIAPEAAPADAEVAASEAKPAEQPAEAPAPEEKPVEQPAEAPAESEKVEFKSAEPVKKIKVRRRYMPWKCHKCDSTNDWQFQYCPKCGEIRHFDWKCAGCGQHNPSEYKFCPGCGKTRTREEENIISYSEAEYKSMDKQALYDKLEEMESAAEIYEYMRGLYGNETDDTIHAFLEVLRNNVRLEKLHGNGKIGTINQIKAFFDYGKRPLQIDYSGDTIICPSCGYAQPSNRKNCKHCNVMLVKR